MFSMIEARSINDRAFLLSRISMIEKWFRGFDKRIKMIVMKFLVIVLAIRFVFYLLDQIGRKKEFDMSEYEEDWSNPSEHNVWW